MTLRDPELPLANDGFRAHQLRRKTRLFLQMHVAQQLLQ